MSTGEQRAPAAGPAEWRWSPCCFGFHAPSVNFSALRSMLAKRLLIKGDYNCDRELRTLELLKVRFGESNLHNAEVMLKVSAASYITGQVWAPEKGGAVFEEAGRGKPAQCRGHAQGEQSQRLLDKRGGYQECWAVC